MPTLEDQINACLQHNLGCQEREDMTDEQLDYIQHQIAEATAQIMQIIQENK